MREEEWVKTHVFKDKYVNTKKEEEDSRSNQKKKKKTMQRIYKRGKLSNTTIKNEENKMKWNGCVCVCVCVGVRNTV